MSRQKWKLGLALGAMAISIISAFFAWYELRTQKQKTRAKPGPKPQPKQENAVVRNQHGHEDSLIKARAALAKKRADQKASEAQSEKEDSIQVENTPASMEEIDQINAEIQEILNEKDGD